jgi:hypothetical protein
LCTLQIATATLLVKSSSTPPLPRSGRRCLYLAATLLRLPPPLHDHLNLDIKGLLSACGTRRFLLQSQHTHHHDTATAAGCQFVGFYLRLILQSHRLWCSRCDCGEMLEVYLVGYILCIIDCHICQDIFGMLYIMYCTLPYVSRGALPLKTLVLYIYRLRGTM